MMSARIPPDAILLACGTLMWLVSKWFTSGHFILPYHILLFGLFLIIGFAISLSGTSTLRRQRTTTRPHKASLMKTTALVTGGIYQYTRNPVYLGMVIILLGWMLFLENWLSISGVILFIVFITIYQIMPEEKALQKTYGETYTQYKKRVRR